MKENVGSKQIPNYDTAFTPNPYGITLPVSDGDTLDAVVPVFADIDSDGDYDLFYGGTFLNNMPDEAFYFSRNIDSSGNGTDPQFDTIEKNPFGLIFPEGSTFHWEIFQDMDCDGDLDMYMTGLNDDYYYFENIGTPTTPEFKEGVCIRRVCEYQDPFEPIDGRFWDIGGDGDPDMIAGTFASGFTYFENISPVPDLDFHISSDAFTYQFSDI